MNLPIECIEAIVHQIDATCNNNLFSLLTVNRVFFELSVRRLYCNPVQTVQGCHSLRAAKGLLALILRYSPAQDLDVQSLRFSLSTELDALPRMPAVDYLSLIKTIQYDAQWYGPSSFLAVSYPLSCSGEPLPRGMGVHDALAWAACGHRLFDVDHMDISWCDLFRYCRRIDGMASMRSIRLITLEIPAFEHSVARNAIQFDLQNVSYFLDKWLEARAKCRGNQTRFEIHSGGNDNVDWFDPRLSALLKEIFDKMPISTLRKVDYRNKLEWARLVKAPETLDLSHVEHFVGTVKGGTLGYNLSLPLLDAVRALKQCRSLHSLDLRCESTIKDDLFDWAFQERIDATSSTWSNPRQHHLIPLSFLSLSLCAPVEWQSAIYAFGATLQSVSIADVSHFNRVDLCAFQDMPELCCLKISTRKIEVSKCAAAVAVAPPFSGCPKLEELCLISLEPSEVVQYDPWLLPSVQTLSLCGPVSHHFHQATLQTMRNLKHLSLSDEPLQLFVDGASSFMWDMSHLVHVPSLHSLSLRGTMVDTFEWHMLDHCKGLKELDLCTLYLSSARQPVLAIESATLPPTILSELEVISILNIKIKMADLMDALPRLAPNIKQLSMSNGVHVDEKLHIKLKAKLPLLENLSW